MRAGVKVRVRARVQVWEWEWVGVEAVVAASSGGQWRGFQGWRSGARGGLGEGEGRGVGVYPEVAYPDVAAIYSLVTALTTASGR